jgi:multiple sugar transport system permease protein
MSVSAHTRTLPRARVRQTGQQPRALVLPQNWWVFVLFVIGLVLVAGPFVWMVASSFKDAQELHAFPPTLLPVRPTLDNYTTLFQKLDFPLFFFNSLVVAFFVVFANLLFCSMLGYALAKLHFSGRDQIFLLVMATLMVPSTVTLVPLFVLMSSLGLVNSFPALILPFAAGPFGVFLMRQFMLSVPDDLLEAARIDGSSELVVSTSERMYTLPVAVATFAIGQNATDYGLLMAGSTVLVAPVLAVFFALQRYFQPGIATTGLKG